MHPFGLIGAVSLQIRTGFFKPSCSGKIHLKAGAIVELTTDYDFKGDETKFACTYKMLPQSVSPGSTVLIADGSLVLTVTECSTDSVKCRIENDCSIGERKNMNLPNVKVDLPGARQAATLDRGPGALRSLLIPPPRRSVVQCSSRKTLTTCRILVCPTRSISSRPPSFRAPPTCAQPLWTCQPAY